LRARYPSTGRTEIASPRVKSQRELGASPLASRLAASHRPNRVSYRTDWSFTSCCSPPRVTTTQLQADYPDPPIRGGVFRLACLGSVVEPCRDGRWEIVGSAGMF